MKLDARKMEWIRAPKECLVTENTVEIVTEPFTDLWQRTYYHFRNDSAPVLQFKTEEQFFSFVVKTDFDSHFGRFHCVNIQHPFYTKSM